MAVPAPRASEFALRAHEPLAELGQRGGRQASRFVALAAGLPVTPDRNVREHAARRREMLDEDLRLELLVVR